MRPPFFVSGRRPNPAMGRRDTLRAWEGMSVMADANETAKRLLQVELERRQVDYRELTRLLGLLGLEASEAEVAQRVEAADGPFLVQCCEAIGVPVVRLDF